MDYDLTDIPGAYDRSRDHGPEMLGLWMNVVASHVAHQRVTRMVDLGCGTGRFTAPLATWFRSKVIGIDPSKKMLEQARAKEPAAAVAYVRGRAEAIPLGAGSLDVIFMSMSFHHFADPDLAARECRRVLRNGGTVLVRTGTREQIAAYPYVPFFERTRSMIEQLLPDHARLRTVFEIAGFRLIASEIVTQSVAPTWAAYVEKVAARGDSVLARLSDTEFEAGLARMRTHVCGTTAQPVLEPIDFFVFRTAP